MAKEMDRRHLVVQALEVVLSLEEVYCEQVADGRMSAVEGKQSHGFAVVIRGILNDSWKAGASAVITCVPGHGSGFEAKEVVVCCYIAVADVKIVAPVLKGLERNDCFLSVILRSAISIVNIDIRKQYSFWFCESGKSSAELLGQGGVVRRLTQGGNQD